MNHPIIEYQTTISRALTPFCKDRNILVRLLVAAQASVAKMIIRSPISLWLNGISVFGLQPITTAAPEITTRSPRAILAEIFWPSIGEAKSTVNTGFSVMINDPSPAAVHFIPCMKNS